MNRVTARLCDVNQQKIEQGDIFKDVELIESISMSGDELKVSKITFPYSMCMNQTCDLESDLRARVLAQSQDGLLLQLIMLPVFVAEKVREGSMWGKLKSVQRINSEKWRPITINDVSRYHYLQFGEEEHIGPFVIDFKHFFTVSRNYLYANISKRICSIAPLYRENISTRFANYLSRIGLP